MDESLSFWIFYYLISNISKISQIINWFEILSVPTAKITNVHFWITKKYMTLKRQLVYLTCIQIANMILINFLSAFLKNPWNPQKTSSRLIVLNIINTQIQYDNGINSTVIFRTTMIKGTLLFNSYLWDTANVFSIP